MEHVYKSESETLVNEGRDGDGLGVGLWARLWYGGMYGVSHRRSIFGVWVREFSGDACRRLCPLTNAPSATTGISPFFANKGYHPNLTIHPEQVFASAHAKDLVVNLDKLHQELKATITDAQ